MTSKELLNSFTLENLPDLDTVTLGALELFSDVNLPEITFHQFKRPLVVGSVNGSFAGKILFADIDAVFADESSYIEKLDAVKEIDGAFLVSASGSKHAIEIARELSNRNIKTCLLTNNPQAPAKEYIPEHNVFIFPKNREPYTYNTSTYMGLFLSKTHEDPGLVLSFIEEKVLPTIPNNLHTYKAYCLVIPPHFYGLREMLITKFDELFGPKVVGRVFTTEQMKHAKTVILADEELFITFGDVHEDLGLTQNKLAIPLPANADHVAMMAIGYYVIGHIQKQLPPFFKENIVGYTDRASHIFGQRLEPIVE